MLTWFEEVSLVDYTCQPRHFLLLWFKQAILASSRHLVPPLIKECPPCNSVVLMPLTSNQSFSIQRYVCTCIHVFVCFMVAFRHSQWYFSHIVVCHMSRHIDVQTVWHTVVLPLHGQAGFFYNPSQTQTQDHTFSYFSNDQAPLSFNWVRTYDQRMPKTRQTTR